MYILNLKRFVQMITNIAKCLIDFEFSKATLKRLKYGLYLIIYKIPDFYRV